MRYRYGVFPESGFVGDKLYPAHYEFGGAERDNAGCDGISPQNWQNNWKATGYENLRNEKSFGMGMDNYKEQDSSETFSHITVPFLPHDDDDENDEDLKQLKLAAFTTPSFKVCNRNPVSITINIYIYIYIYPIIHFHCDNINDIFMNCVVHGARVLPIRAGINTLAHPRWERSGKALAPFRAECF